MKVSVSLPEVDVAYLDAYASEHAIGSRSAALQHAVKALRAVSLKDDYEAAFDEWAAGEDAEPWERTAHDGLAR